MTARARIGALLAALPLAICPPALGDPPSPTPIGLASSGASEGMDPTGVRATVELHRAVGTLQVGGLYTNDPYDIYFHVPVPYRDQVPVLIEVAGPDLIEHRFLRLDAANAIVCARLGHAPSHVVWTAHVLVAPRAYADLPGAAPLPDPAALPDSLSRWLLPTDCAQIEEPLIQDEAQALLDASANLSVLATRIVSYVSDIPTAFPHDPWAFDAYYTLRWWGNSCTGHAHAAAALFRAAGVPARVLMTTLPYMSGPMDMHWVIEFWMTDYGWVRMDPQAGWYPTDSRYHVLTFAPDPADEFPLFYPAGVEGMWHSSDPALGTGNPSWHLAHTATHVAAPNAGSSAIDAAFAVTRDVFDLHAACQGAALHPAHQGKATAALALQQEALVELMAGDLEWYTVLMQLARMRYWEIGLADVETIFRDDCEGGANGWTHGGIMDMWELGAPAEVGPDGCPSGACCWATNIDGDYFYDQDMWLLSPPIDLAGFSLAMLDLKLWLLNEDVPLGEIIDPLWLEISTDDGATFQPLCDELCAGNDDPEVPALGGWGRLALDLGAYLGETVRIRIRFRSDSFGVQPGAYIDDIRVTGRRRPPLTAVEPSGPPGPGLLLAAHPNPCNPSALVSFVLPATSCVRLAVYDPAGRRQRRLLAGERREAGRHAVAWDGRDERGHALASGLYLLRLEACGRREGAKLLLLH
ncbi:MAG: hypothetical protein JW819_12365 [Candidatus Krumholzibacteriota bacterium]|nr:hypothetical protein [Candidatus Krumholzibacteriota bacterium]